MSSTLTSRIQRELKASPQKAALLALLCSVAIYFWMPLVLGKGDKALPPTATTGTAVNGVGATMVADTVGGGAMTNETGTSNKEAFTPPAWRKMNDWVRHDPRHAPAVRLESRDPFATLAVVKEIAAPKPLVRSVPEPDITPQQAKITLNSTLVGGQRRVAVINGKTYRIGQLVAGETAKAKIQFTVADISQKVVVLERDGKKFDIKLHSFELTEPSDESALEGSK